MFMKIVVQKIFERIYLILKLYNNISLYKKKSIGFLLIVYKPVELSHLSKFNNLNHLHNYLTVFDLSFQCKINYFRIIKTSKLNISHQYFSNFIT